MLKVSL